MRYLLVFLFVLTACLPEKEMVRNLYTEQVIDGQELAVVISYIELQNHTSFSNIFSIPDNPASQSDFLMNQFKDLINKHSSFEVVHYLTLPYGTEMESRRMPLDKETVRIALPADGEKFTLDNYTPKYVLFIDKLRFWSEYLQQSVDDRLTKNNELQQDNPLAVETASETIRMDYRFAIWDNDAGKVINYGHISNYSKSVTAIDQESWMELLDEAFARMFRKSPFATNLP